jgi:hypothetical protein
MQDELKNNREIKVWNYLYRVSKKDVKKLMDSTWVKSVDN